ncbi:MAG: hypothetical protein RLZZ617_1285, partial [Bacteroidota bacterium]
MIVLDLILPILCLTTAMHPTARAYGYASEMVQDQN